MRQPAQIKRYSLARPGVAKARRDEGMKRLRLVRMEAIAELDHRPRPVHGRR